MSQLLSRQLFSVSVSLSLRNACLILMTQPCELGLIYLCSEIVSLLLLLFIFSCQARSEFVPKQKRSA